MGIKFQNYYDVLGINRDASEKEVKTAYRKLARKFHPDLHAADEKAAAEKKFKQINEAYEVLIDQEKRQKYDRLGKSYQAGEEFRPDMDDGIHYSSTDSASGFSDFFDILFGGFRKGTAASAGEQPFHRAPRRGQDVEAELALTLEEAYRGGEKTIQLNVSDNCTYCGGSGISGRQFCPACAGSGQKQTPRTITVKIPPGTKDNTKIRLRNQGGGEEGRRGDLYLKILLLPHVNYKVTGDDLESELVIAPWQAVLGAKINAATLDGPVQVTVPAGTRSGKKLRLRSKGLPKKDSGRGDQYLNVLIDIPRQSGEEELALWRKLAEVQTAKEASK